MFTFWQGILHDFKDASYTENNLVLSYVLDVNFERMFWIVPNGKYQIVNENVFNNFLDIILIMGITHRWQTLLQKVL
jgi:hypothetical protein